ncbi:MAG: MFS transporter [Clostridiales Family XIII bacterium]|jgi:MFS family permease|nr:MFS transporter [Clostridiales Family XIII bacterium]
MGGTELKTDGRKKIQLKQDGRFFFGWWVVFLGFLLMTFGYVGYVSLTSVFAAPVLAELQIDRSVFMLYMTILACACLIASPFIGRFMMKGNMKLYMVIASVLGFLGYFGFSRSSEPWHFYLFAILLGLGYAGTAPMPVSLIINQWFGGKIRGTATGLAFIGSGLGGMILTPVLNAVITNFGWRTSYVVLGLIFIVILIPATLLLAEKLPEKKGFRRMGETQGETSAVTEKKGMSMNEAKNTPAFWLAFISGILVVLASSALLANSVLFFIDNGVDPAKAAGWAGLILGSLIVGKPLIGFIVDRLGIRFGAPLATFLFALTFVALFLTPALGPGVAIVMIVLFYGLGGPAITIIPPLLVNGLFSEKDYGTIVGIMNTATSVGGAFGGMVAAKVFDVTGSYSSFWLVAAIGVAVAAVLRIICFKVQAKYITW